MPAVRLAASEFGKTSTEAGKLPAEGVALNQLTLLLATLAEESQLLTDGVAEARDESGALFGFDGTAAISGQSADQIVKTAEMFGQGDDITVLTLARTA